MSRIALLFLVAGIVVLRQYGYLPRAAAQEETQDGASPPRVSLPSDPREAAAVALLAAVGNPQPSAAMIAEVVTWSVAEDGGDGAMQRNNPWNTTMCGHNFVGSINGDGACGVGHYATMDDGIAANADTLMQANFAAVRAALLANDAEGFRQALWASPWASSHYGYGASWPR